MPETEVKAVIAHAFDVGSGRVGRTGLLDLEEKCRLAVLAHVRHKKTDYETLLRRVGREEARDLVRDEISDQLYLWEGD